MEIRNEKGYIKYTIEEDEITLDMIEVKVKHQGAGSELLNKLKDIAYSLDKKIGLYAYPQDDSITQEELRNFYYKNGFELDPDDVDYNLFVYNV